jgi:hypothetical protein
LIIATLRRAIVVNTVARALIVAIAGTTRKANHYQ